MQNWYILKHFTTNPGFSNQQSNFNPCDIHNSRHEKTIWQNNNFSKNWQLTLELWCH